MLDPAWEFSCSTFLLIKKLDHAELVSNYGAYSLRTHRMLE